jgi:shikimate dehydrogenase
MGDLDKLRSEIDAIDRDILNAFERRTAVARQIGNVKRASGKAVVDSAREEELFAKLKKAAGFESRPYVEDLYRELLRLSKIHQNKPAFGVLGRMLGHTYSPEIHNLLDPSYTYSVIEREPTELDELFEGHVFNGFNVTIPYKKEAAARCDELDEAAQETGSVNTVVFGSDGKTYGYNTDYFGFIYMVNRKGIEIAGKDVLVLGTGGAAAAVNYALKTLGAANILSCGRTSEINYDNVYDMACNVQVIVNTTPVGMYPNVNERLIDLSGFPRLEACCDLIYNPSRTRFLQDAEDLGLKFCGGLSMLVAQAYKASMLFRGDTEAAAKLGFEKNETIEQIIRTLKLKMRNITLIGMPGCGKTTMAKRISAITGRKLVDLDYAYRDKYGMTSAEAISGLGEDAFRDNECEVAAEILPQSGLVISCGGGIVTRPENKFYVRCNSYVIYLERPLETLSDHNRPVSIQHGVEKLYSQRKEAYETWCDYKLHLERFEDKASYSDGAGKAAMELIEKMKGTL